MLNEAYNALSFLDCWFLFAVVVLNVFILLKLSLSIFPQKVNFEEVFAWPIALLKILTMDNLRKRQLIVVD
jgi:hypothetical protein